MARKTGSHGEITGPRIRKVARTLFARHGYAAVSMRQIAAEVGVQAGALYAYTPDKQSLLVSLMREHIEDLLALWAAEPVIADPRARLARFVHFHIDRNVDQAEAIFIAYMEPRNLDPGNFAEIEGLRRRYEAIIEDCLREGSAQGLFRHADARLATMAVIAMLNGVMNWYREGGRLSRDEVARTYAELVLGAVGATGD